MGPVTATPYTHCDRYLAAAAILQLTPDQLPLYLVDPGDGYHWVQVANLAQLDPPMEMTRREVRNRLTAALEALQ